MSATRNKPSIGVSHPRENAGFHTLVQLAGMLVLALTLFSPAMVRAQFLDPNLVSFVPDPPVADRPFELVILVVPCLTGYLSSEGATVSVTNGQIEVKVHLVPVLVCPPLPNYEIIIPIAPLPAGTYEVLVIGQNNGNPDSNIPLILTSVDVVPAGLAIPMPTQIPASSPIWLVFLVAAVLLLGAARARYSG